MSTVVETVIGVAGLGVLGALLIMVKTLFAMRRDVVSYGKTLSALVRSLGDLITANRLQNFMLKGMGANGATDKADECLDSADKELRALLSESVGAETK